MQSKYLPVTCILVSRGVGVKTLGRHQPSSSVFNELCVVFINRTLLWVCGKPPIVLAIAYIVWGRVFKSETIYV